MRRGVMFGASVATAGALMAGCGGEGSPPGQLQPNPYTCEVASVTHLGKGSDRWDDYKLGINIREKKDADPAARIALGQLVANVVLDGTNNVLVGAVAKVQPGSSEMPFSPLDGVDARTVVYRARLVGGGGVAGVGCANELRVHNGVDLRRAPAKT
jgi:hypothetical protein